MPRLQAATAQPCPPYPGCQPVVLIPGQLLLPVPGHLDYILLQNAVDGNGEMDHQPVISIFRQAVHPLIYYTFPSNY